ncbi:MAG TPA: hypothetical protein VME70_03350 [Mycobacteriales bacterium]|nr:hypothetical protein [Mycobacteriales bacterium]
MGNELGPEEDSELRRLHVLKSFGMVAGSVTSRYEALRHRDRRRQIRDPEENTVAAPVDKPDWPAHRTAKPATAPATPPSNSSAPQRVVSDTREIFGSAPQSRRGRGLFRR